MKAESAKTYANPTASFKLVGVIVTLILSVSAVAAAPLYQELQKKDITPSQTFGRMFHHLPSFAPATDEVIDALLEVGKKGGLMDANDDLAAGPILLITDPNESLINRNNPTHTAGVTFFGQFLDHDMTFDQTSQLGVPAPPRKSPNARTAFFDLDSVYGDGPTGSPELFDPADPSKFRVETGGQFEDLPRAAKQASHYR